MNFLSISSNLFNSKKITIINLNPLSFLQGSSGTQYSVLKNVGNYNHTITTTSSCVMNVFVVAGGGSGGSGNQGAELGAGGGAGGYILQSYNLQQNTTYAISCSVGQGGATSLYVDNKGSNSTFSITGQATLTAIGGGAGISGGRASEMPSASGGSGGGGGYSFNTGGSGTPGQGNNGGNGIYQSGGWCGGGGGGGGVGGNASQNQAGKGGIGIKPTLRGIGLNNGDPIE